MVRLFHQHQVAISPGPYYERETSLPAQSPPAYSVRLIAYYLPQFHAIPENDHWWGKGFTEWTNVTKALPRYAGHLQPRLPADLGFYNLRDPAALRAQAILAQRAGIFGFCIHDYWFSGRKVLATPLANLLADREIDIRFCINWANENWTRRWDGAEHEILLQQHHNPEQDIAYLTSILPALRDPRYITVGGRPLIMVYRPSIIPNVQKMVRLWREYLISENIKNPYLVMAQVFGETDPRRYGFDAAAGFPPHNSNWYETNERDYLQMLDRKFSGHVRSYTSLVDSMLAIRPTDFTLFPGVAPGWDNEARKPGKGAGFYGATPKAYGRWLHEAATRTMHHSNPDERIVFINAWNEWAEGAVLEPDRHFGHAFLAETRRVIDSLAQGNGVPATRYEAAGVQHGAERSYIRYITNKIVRRVHNSLQAKIDRD